MTSCLLCGRELQANVTWLFFVEYFPKVICERCEQSFERISDTESIFDSRLKHELAQNQKSITTLAMKKTTSRSFESEQKHIALYRYNDAMRDFMHRYKFMKDVVLAKVFRKELSNCFRKLNGIIVPIPLHPEKLKERTFAQVDELLNAALVPYEHVLEKMTTESQSSKNRAERLTTQQLFKTIGKIKPKDYIVFDDIYTTGTTIEHAKHALLEAGAKSVKSVTLIRG